MHQTSASHPGTRLPPTLTAAPSLQATHDSRIPSPQRTPSWLGPFFRLASASPLAARCVRPIACRVVPQAAPSVCEAIRLNSYRIFGNHLPPHEQQRFARRVIGSFYDFVLDVSRASRLRATDRSSLIEDVQGLDAYATARAMGRGAILVTAHLGTFEAGLVALARVEKKICVVFKRDAVAAFEGMRARFHDSLGITETPIDDGLGSWLTLRDALLRNEVVVMQGDRAVPGQKSEVVPFLHGHLRLPSGPVRLAQITGSPIIPVFSIRTPKGGIRVLLKTPIKVCQEASSETSHPRAATSALLALGQSIAEVVAEHPDQWLVFEPAFEEDRAHAEH